MFLKSSFPLLVVGLALRVVAQPIIVTEPADQAVPAGGVTALFVRAEGPGPITYQWFFNGTNNPIAHATNAILVLSNAAGSAGQYSVRLRQADQVLWSRSAQVSLFTLSLPPFGTLTLTQAFELNGAGTDVDSIAFWEAPQPTNTMMFVTGKGNDRLEVWRYPFVGSEQPYRAFPANINGVAVDQETDLLYVTDRIVSVLSLTNLQLQLTFGQGTIGVGENNIAILKATNGQTVIYVSEDHRVHRFDAATTNHLGSFAPPVSSIETIVADNFHQAIFVPEEQGPAGNPGVYVYHPDGTPYLKNGTNRFGQSGIFDSDEEGILLYTFPPSAQGDNGAGFIVVTDQKSDVTDFEFFDRQSWAHLGAIRLQGVSNTDGIASTQQAMPGYPLGLFAAIDNDTTTVGLGWDAIFSAVGFQPLPRVLRITPAKATVNPGEDLAFTIEFNEPIRQLNDAADLRITHFGTRHTGVTITGSNMLYQVVLTGISGQGQLLMGLNLSSDLQNPAGTPLASSLTSVPVSVRSPYQAWADQHGVAPGTPSEYSADPDNDHVPNFEEFATDGHPLDANDPRKELVMLSPFGGTSYLTYTFPVRIGAVFTGTNALTATVDEITYALSGGLDVTTFDQHVVEIIPAIDSGLPSPSPGWTYRTFALPQPLSAPSTGFIRRRIAPVP